MGKQYGARDELDRLKWFTKSLTTTAVRVSETQEKKRYVLLLADIANTDVIYVGNEDIQDIPLLAGGYIQLYTDLYDVYVKSETGTQTLHVITQDEEPILFSLGRLLQSESYPNLRVRLYESNTGIDGAAQGADGRSNTAGRLFVEAYKMLYNESSWDRQRGNTEITILDSAARTTSGNSNDITNYNARGIILFIDVTAVSGTNPTLNVFIQAKDPRSGNYRQITPDITISATGTFAVACYPGATDTGNYLNAINDIPLPRTFRVRYVIGGTSPSFTFTVAGCLIV